MAWGVARDEFDVTVAEVGEGRPLGSVDGISHRDRDGRVAPNPDREILEDMDRLPFVTPVPRRLREGGEFVRFLNRRARAGRPA